MYFKKAVFFTAIVITILIFTGCFSTPKPGKIVFDTELNPEKATVVEFSSSIFVNQYNGIDVNKTWYPKGTWRKNIVTLPAGMTAITFDYWWAPTLGNTTYIIKDENVVLRYNFEAGKEYVVALYMEYKGGKSLLKYGDYEIGLGIWDKASNTGLKKEYALRTWEFGEIRA